MLNESICLFVSFLFSVKFKMNYLLNPVSSLHRVCYKDFCLKIIFELSIIGVEIETHCKNEFEELSLGIKNDIMKSQ